MKIFDNIFFLLTLNLLILFIGIKLFLDSL
ncbi:Uncharacterised protein [Campylobacter hyointestinalis subsp. hyointestinalis]|nr:Uncharacterised protein [Campylobacter hyointestinalis subsp. hyointestinalis]